MIFRTSRKPFDIEDSPLVDLTFTNLINVLSEENIEFDERSLRLKNSKNFIVMRLLFRVSKAQPLLN